MMKKKSRIQIAGEIIAQVRREMQLPRMTESSRNFILAQAALEPKNMQSALRVGATGLVGQTHPNFLAKE
jgi:hypothetical protein